MAKGRISKQVFQENKALQILRKKEHFLPPDMHKVLYKSVLLFIIACRHLSLTYLAQKILYKSVLLSSKNGVFVFPGPRPFAWPPDLAPNLHFTGPGP